MKLHLKTTPWKKPAHAIIDKILWSILFYNTLAFVLIIWNLTTAAIVTLCFSQLTYIAITISHNKHTRENGEHHDSNT